MKKLLQSFGLFGIVVFAAACLWEALAQGPASPPRLRDLQDVRIATTPTSGHVLSWNGTRWTNSASSGGTLTGSGTNATLAEWTGTTNLGSIGNGVGILTNDGSGGFGFTTNISQAITVNNFSTTNLTVFNTLTVSNIVTTNITVQNNLTVSNLYTVNGNHNSLIVTQALTLNSLKTNLLAVTSTGLITNANYGTGLTWTPSTLTLSASSGTTVSVNATNVTTPNLQDTATVTWGVSGSNVTATAVSSGGSVSVNATNVTTPNLKDSADVTWSITTASNAIPAFAALTWNTLTYSASNVVMDCSLGNSQEAHYKLVLTNSTTQFGIPTSIPSTPKTYWIWLQQDSTGVRTVQWTNAATGFKFPGTTQPVITTNANAQTLIMFATGPFTNSVLNYVGIVPQIQ